MHQGRDTDRNRGERGRAPPRAVDVAVIGAGVSGLATAREVARLAPRASVVVIEAEKRPGGTMRSDRVKGCLCEWGPNGFLTNVPDTWDLAGELGLENRLLPADASAETRFLYVRGALRPVPMSPAAFLLSDLLSLKGRLRILLEPFMARAPAGSEDSVYSFAARRIGHEAASVLVDAMVSGIHAGNSAEVSLRAAFPRMADMEDRYGSLVTAMIAKQLAAWKATKKGARPAEPAGGPAGPGGRLVSFDEGMEVLIRALAGSIGNRLFVGTRVNRIDALGNGYRVSFERDGVPGTLNARQAVLATPAYVAAAMAGDDLTPLVAALNAFHYSAIAVVCMIYRRGQIAHPLDGFGFLVPHGQGPRMLGCIWTGSIFPAHVSGDRVLLRTMIGGARDPEGALMSEGRTSDLVHNELHRVLGGIEGTPDTVRIYRHPRGIPQYTLGHLNRVDALDRLLATRPGLHLAGNAYRGIGVNDCVREAGALARTIVGSLPGSPTPALAGATEEGS